MTQIAIRIVLISIILNLLQQTSPTSPATGYVKMVKPDKATTNNKGMVSSKNEENPIVVYLYERLRKTPVALTTATKKTTYKPNLVVTQVVLYCFESEGGQHEDVDGGVPLPIEDNSGDRSPEIISELTTIFFENKSFNQVILFLV